MTEPLTNPEIKALPEGAAIEIVWSGGNGPHQGRVVFDHRGEPYYVPEQEFPKGPEGPMWFYNPITFVGEAPPFTVVRRLP